MALQGGQQREKRECEFTAQHSRAQHPALDSFLDDDDVEAETGGRFGSAAVLPALSAAQGRGRRVLLGLADINPVGAEGGYALSSALGPTRHM